MRSRITSLTIALSLALTGAQASAQALDVPANLEVPAGVQPFLTAQAIGTQNYVCMLAPGGFGWTFFGPQATLYVEAEQVTTHFLSSNPHQSGAARATWQHAADSSAIWAVPVASSSDSQFVESGAIPWLLLTVVGRQAGPTGGVTLLSASFIHRVHTSGGVAPAGGCKSAGDIGKKALVPYTTDYVFYR